MSIRIKRSSGDTAPASLVSGQLAYVEGSTNGGTLYIGEIGGTVRAIGGHKYVDKLNGIEAGAQVNTVTSVAGRTGVITLTSADITNFSTAVTSVIGATSLDALSDVYTPTPSNGQQLAWNSTNSRWEAVAPSSGVTQFISLNDVPSSYSGKGTYIVRVNSAATALEFVQDLDDGTF